MNTERHTLTDSQIELLKFLGNRTISDAEMNDIKRLVSLYFLRKADFEMDEIWEQKGLSTNKMDEILNVVLINS